MTRRTLAYLFAFLLFCYIGGAVLTYLVGCGPSNSWNPSTWFQPPATGGGGKSAPPTFESDLRRICYPLSAACIVFGVVGLVLSTKLSLISSRTAATSLVAGFGLLLVTSLLVQYAWLVKIVAGLSLLAIAAMVVHACYLKYREMLTGKPAESASPIDLIPKFIRAKFAAKPTPPT